MKKVYSVEGRVKIKNAKGTGDRSCKCASWIKHWEKYSNKSANKCVVDGCNNSANVGAHITRPNAKSEDYKTHPYIVPFCSSHNGKHGEEFYSKINTTFVWANVKETCGK
ncbi:hypothetical protein RUX70_004440 [Vibrio vulnificus]|uniref:hypothetical protein n=1 Tax=Vibrio vulnificus TaxID=672 RepID=UPI0007353811|nr:hypothetical protein [Vibrio vulnificus]EHU0329790.1 hypothetical protein [Vibrio vulnificus]EII3056986.1 hypothetical protein [Vibrio vulnificus]ELK2038331.1 hypothetical protein [Vibrio vulnificus]ELK2284134.1 hypothetical protein [Vibrio vulnificus]ELV8693130.1 hypothetical protein [Vibrio vulnificus]